MNIERKVSVIIPVYNGRTALDSCLTALLAQTLPREQYEIIVVDNGSTDGTAEVARSRQGVRLIHEATPGSYAARNAGILASRHPVLAFTDADCIPDERWLEEGLDALSTLGGQGFIGGRIAFTFRNPQKPSLFEQYDSLFFLNNENNIRGHDFAVTANMLTTRAVMDTAGLFNLDLKSGGDREWGQRATAAGFACDYTPNAFVYHAARNSLGSLTRKSRRVVSGLRVVDKRAAKPVRHILDYMAPPFRRIRTVLGNKDLGPVSRRIALSGLLYYLKLVAFFELIRLHSGATAERQ